MAFRPQNGILISSLILVFLLSVTGVSHAVLSMNEVQYLFEQEKGLLWKEATSQEKKDFIRDVQGREEFQEGPFKEKKRELKERSGTVEMSTVSEKRKKKAPYEVRSSFEAETGIEWSDATEEEQEDFWREYKIEEKKLREKEKLYLKKQKLLEKKRKTALQLKKQEIKLKRKLRDQEEKLRRAEIKRKRVEDKRKAEEKKTGVGSLSPKV